MKKVLLVSFIFLALVFTYQSHASRVAKPLDCTKVLKCKTTTTYHYVASRFDSGLGTIVTTWAWMHTNSECKISVGQVTVIGAGNPFVRSSVQWEDPEIIGTLGINRGLIENLLISKTQAEDFSSFTTSF